MTDRIYIFSNGSQYADWQASNCHRCKKFPWTLPDCDIDIALAEAYLNNGKVSQEIANRAGYDPDKYVWPCSEVEWTEEWKLEYLERECVLTIEEIKELYRLLPDDETLLRVCENANLYGYEETRKMILKGEIAS